MGSKTVNRWNAETRISWALAMAAMVGSLFAPPADAAPIFNPVTGHFYDIVAAPTGGPLTWTAAEAAAQGIAPGAHLVTINDAAENAFLVATFGGTERFWIGFNDAATEGLFAWSSGEAVTFTNWAPGEPNNLGNEDYTVINWSAPGNWNDCPDTGCNGHRGIAEWAAVPEPASLALLGVGLVGAAFSRRRRA